MTNIKADPSYIKHNLQTFPKKTRRKNNPKIISQPTPGFRLNELLAACL
jgi:hypothetical protein